MPRLTSITIPRPMIPDLAFITLALAPLAFLVVVGWLGFARRWQALGFGLGLAAAAAAAWVWAIFQSQSSTAPLGFLFLPGVAGSAGLLAIGFALLRRAPSAGRRALGALSLLGALAIVIASLASGVMTRQRYAERDAQHLAREQRIRTMTSALDSLMLRDGAAHPDTLDNLIRARGHDRDFLIAALKRPEIGSALLDSLAGANDLGIVLSVVRNTSTAPATLARVYTSREDASYFHQALAANPETPPEILRAIYDIRPPRISGLEYWFAGNRATPHDILEAIAGSVTRVDIVYSLLRNQAADCALLALASRSLADAGEAATAVRGEIRDRCAADTTQAPRTATGH